MNDLISVIVPVYNVEKYLQRCIQSLINQSYKMLEIILIDDGSTDKSGIICDYFAEHDPRIKVHHKENGGQGSARNIGLNNAKGKYITFVDSDDYVDEDYIEFLRDFIKQDNLDIACCNCQLINENGDIKRINRCGLGKKYYTPIEAIKSTWYGEEFNIAPWGKLYRSVLWDNIRFKECFSEDLATMHLLYIKAQRIGYSYEAKINWTIRNNSDIHSFNSKKLIMPQIVIDNIEFAEKYPELKKAAVHKAIMVNFHVLCQLPPNRYEDEKNKMISFIKQNRKKVLLDKRASRKAKVAILLSYTGINNVKKILSMIKKIDNAF